MSKLRTDAKKAIAEAAAEAAKSFVAESEKRLGEAERQSVALAVRRVPLGRDGDGTNYWWLPAVAPRLVLLESEGERAFFPSHFSPFSCKFKVGNPLLDYN